jgi:hypothetical protein
MPSADRLMARVPDPRTYPVATWIRTAAAAHHAETPGEPELIWTSVVDLFVRSSSNCPVRANPATAVALTRAVVVRSGGPGAESFSSTLRNPWLVDL